ncbi:MAG: phosphomethylpyrimidine synthase ThiC [Planctomycetota bacterium]|jgi:phosphomethylpyrimidine synthase|nr:phosphomethylpyrimidine synthase ThiC [Planctomycetota bacterium]
MTIIETLRAGKTDPRLAAVARHEKMEEAVLASRLLDGTAVVPWARGTVLEKPIAIGKGCRVKVNANIGTSPDKNDVDFELAKLRAAVDAGVDAVMDLSTGGDLRIIRKRVREACGVSLGRVPMYEAAFMCSSRGEPFRRMTERDMLEAVRLHVEDGVDFVTVHCGITRAAVDFIRANPRVCGIVSRGGSLLARWMVANNIENPLYTHYDEVIDMCKSRDVAISLGDALRPGALADAGDRAQIHELYTLGELARRARAKGVQVFIEGPGHVPFDQIPAQMKLEKQACDGAPFYVLGPLVTDVAPGYDHLVGAIGGTLAATCGADFLCYVTPAEHLRLPDVEDVRQGVIASRIAAHAADVANGIPGARDWDDAMSRARKARDWDAQFALAIDPELAKRSRSQAEPKNAGVCSMCGEFCALRDEDSLF